MKYQTTAAMVALLGLTSARDLAFGSKAKREVPQEHAHNDILDVTNINLKLDNPLEIQDAVFSLLGNKAAAEGAPNVENLDCLQQIVADQAFTNAKAAGDIDGMAAAIQFRALERNTGSVGLASVLCTEIAVNPEIAAITQHQDPASPEAAGNKQIALDVAVQLASIGADPNLAIGTGTFAPGDLDDPTGAGNTCDTIDDANGCINTLGLLVPDVTEEEIAEAVAAAGGAAGGGAGNAGNAGDAGNAGNGTDVGNGSGCGAAPVATQAPAAGVGAGNANAGNGKDNAGNGNVNAGNGNANAGSGGATGVNVQTFTGTLGGAPPAVVSSAADAKRPFSVDGSTFVNPGAALQRSCSVQHNKCANAANSGQIEGGVAQCEDQQQQCDAAAASSAAKRAVSKKIRQTGLDFGQCSEPSIQFAAGLDGRKENSFGPVNSADFNHGSALNIKVISGFICSQLGSKCKAAQATVDACNAADQAAQAATGQAAADAFNSALGV